MANQEDSYFCATDIWVTGDYSKVVEATSPDAVYVLAYAGQAIEHDSAVRLGLLTAKTGQVSAKAVALIQTATASVTDKSGSVKE
jgi:hypothetical protein